jgi:CubicO group peptidase (beta-lactamase class C family)
VLDPDATFAEGEGLGEILEAAVPRVCSAAVAVVAVEGTVVAAAAVGELVRYAGAAEVLLAVRPAVRRDSIFDIASITKLFTTVVVLSLVDEGRLGLDEPVTTWLPGRYLAGITLRHLLTHTSGLPAARRAHEEIPGDGEAVHAARMELILSTPPVYPAGERHLYSDVGMITTGRVAEIAGDAPLDELVWERITRPLGLSDTGYRPAASLRLRIAATEDKPDRPGIGCVRGEVHDETAYGLGGVAGHAGVFSTADDLMRFAETLRTGGAPILRPGTVAEMTRDQGVRDAPYAQGLGLRLADPALAAPLLTPAPTHLSSHRLDLSGVRPEPSSSLAWARVLAGRRPYGHSGFTGTSLVVDPARALTFVLLTNNVHPVRGRPGIRELRHAIAAEALRLTEARSQPFGPDSE